MLIRAIRCSPCPIHKPRSNCYTKWNSLATAKWRSSPIGKRCPTIIFHPIRTSFLIVFRVCISSQA
ncbi:Uncharacterised protein [Vibrio cholerae]|nr:Uncharacterised protein [Vibrio cholerae]CSC96036.1 Uncharacterised protein [Vibrio cholerae]CSI78180.1 Uncharacterised protein [Vibrio cholerae]